MCWPTTVQIDQEVRLLVTDSRAPVEILRARLNRRPRHPRALATLLEGLALWSGEPITAAVSVAEPFDFFATVSSVVGEESALVRHEWIGLEQGPYRRIRELGDFRDVIRVHGRRR